MFNSCLIELCIWREARGCSKEARQGVYSVLKNRLAEKYNGATSGAEIILRKFQFSSFNWADPNSDRYPRPDHPADWQAWQEICDLVAADPPDNTGGADHYFDTSIRPPSWANDKNRTAVIAPFHFHKAS